MGARNGKAQDSRTNPNEGHTKLRSHLATTQSYWRQDNLKHNSDLPKTISG